MYVYYIYLCIYIYIYIMENTILIENMQIAMKKLRKMKQWKTFVSKIILKY